LSEEQNSRVAAYLGHVSITGLLLAGFIIGSLGVLNDVTVTQASTVFELANLGGNTSRRAIFLGAMRVGRDHIASTVYTLVLAHTGSSLPLLLLFSVANRSLLDVLTSESVAIDGSIVQQPQRVIAVPGVEQGSKLLCCNMIRRHQS
jgi:uncharacterized membrane protein